MARAIKLRQRPKITLSQSAPISTQAGGFLGLITPLARPQIAGLVALVVYLVRAGTSPRFLGHSDFAYFNYLADAFLHGQLHLRLPTIRDTDLVLFADKTYLYWPPFPAVLVIPLVALFGVAVSDVLYTAMFAAISVALLAKMLEILDEYGVALLTVERRAILIATSAFGSVLLILASHGQVWVTAQVIGWSCVLSATIIAFTRVGAKGYFFVGVALSCATATRLGLLFAGVWLAYYMLKRDWHQRPQERLGKAICGLGPIVITLILMAWYNTARFGNPLDMGLAWHNYSHYWFGSDFARYGVFNIHYLPTNLYHHFIVYPFVTSQVGIGSGIFWMTPILLGGPYALWCYRHQPLVWTLAASCMLVYVPIGLVMGTGYLFGSRYLLDLMVPLIVMTALGIRHWRLDVLQLLLLVSWATFAIGSILLAVHSFATGT